MEVGGAEVLVSQMCRMQREQGHEPSVFAISSLGPLGEELRREGFLVRAEVARHLSDGIQAFHRAFKELRPHVVHLHNPTPTIYAALAARMAGVPIVLSTRHSLVAPPRRLSVEIKYGVAAVCCDWIVGICDATVHNLKSLHTIPNRKIARVYNGTMPVQRVPIEACPQKTGFTLLFVGRLAPVKNLPLLLRAFHAALGSRSDLRLWIVGDGSERTALHRLSQELNITGEVTFWGEQLNVAPFFSAADFFIMSSSSEGLPISLLQAISAGLPAVVPDIGGMGEVVRFAHSGIVVPAADPNGMTAAILELSGDESRRITLGTNARSAFEGSFDISHMIRQYAELYKPIPRRQISA